MSAHLDGLEEASTRSKLQSLSLKFNDDTTSSGASSPMGSLSSRNPRERPTLKIGNLSSPILGVGNYGAPSPSPSGRRLPPKGLPIQTSPSPHTFKSGTLPESSIAEQERKLQEIMSQNGLLQVNGKRVPTKIDDLQLLGDLGNGTCGHVVKMQHKQSGQVIAVKQMRRTGNSDENKRIIMDLDVVLKSNDCEEIVLCLGCFITDSDVWIAMELMSTCFDKLLKQLKQAIPEAICGKVGVATVKALNYLKEKHGVIHRDVKPSNILLDQHGRVKLCDFGISGRLVDSKAKTRSAGCAAYMAPERIDPPNPNKPDYDIRADVWSLGITLVELATGHFPYRDCKTDFEVLTKVLQDDPPLLPRNQGFSIEFCSFVRDCLMKNYKDRPKYKKLLQSQFIIKYEKEEVDVGAWFRSKQKQLESGTPPSTTHNHNLQLDFGPSPAEETRMFKPQPSPRVPRAWRPTVPAYPSAIGERRQPPSPDYEALRQQYGSRSSTVTSKPPSSDPKSPRSLNYSTDSPLLSRSSAYYHDRRFTPSNNGGLFPHSTSSTYSTASPSSYLSSPRSTAGRSGPSSLPDSLRSVVPRYYKESPKPSRKFDFTYPTPLYGGGGGGGGLTTSDHSGYHHQDSSDYGSGGSGGGHDGWDAPRSNQRMATSDYSSQESRAPRPQTAGSDPSQRSPSHEERQSRSYFPSWRSLSSWNWQSPISFRRLRTASSDRSGGFDSSRRFQPSYRSWNEKDNSSYYSMKR